MITQIERTARRVVVELLKSVSGEKMTPQVASAVFAGLRFRSELYASFQAAEEAQRLRTELEELQARFIRLKQSLINK